MQYMQELFLLCKQFKHILLKPPIPSDSYMTQSLILQADPGNERMTQTVVCILMPMAQKVGGIKWILKAHSWSIGINLDETSNMKGRVLEVCYRNCTIDIYWFGLSWATNDATTNRNLETLQWRPPMYTSTEMCRSNLTTSKSGKAEHFAGSHQSQMEQKLYRKHVTGQAFTGSFF